MQAKRQWLKAGREMYDRAYDVEISADLRFASQAQRVSEADEVTAMIGSVPALQGNLALQYDAVRRSLVARGRHDMVRDLGARPPVPQMFGMPSIPMPAQVPPEANGGQVPQ
jgi:hypothetical protein